MDSIQYLYTPDMRRIQFCIEGELDDILRSEAAKRQQSKASLIRECIAVRYARNFRIEDDPLTALVGSVDIDPEDVDDFVYGL